VTSTFTFTLIDAARRGGGSNSLKNLWPESHRSSPWNTQVKDRLEDKLHELVCSGQLDLKTAQQAIASDACTTNPKE
jgi:hypothetical protein